MDGHLWKTLHLPGSRAKRGKKNAYIFPTKFELSQLNNSTISSAREIMIDKHED